VNASNAEKNRNATKATTTYIFKDTRFVIVALPFSSFPCRLEDDETVAVADATSRALLMQKLAGAVTTSGAEAAVAPQPPQEKRDELKTTSSPSPCLVLKNMFDPETETEPNWDEEIKKDVLDECGNFGSIIHIFVDKTSKDGIIYMKFGSVPAAANAVKMLSGRWFAGKQITAEYLNERAYHKKFPESVK
jgi:RNA-binding protein 23/39